MIKYIRKHGFYFVIVNIFAGVFSFLKLLSLTTTILVFFNITEATIEAKILTCLYFIVFYLSEKELDKKAGRWCAY